MFRKPVCRYQRIGEAVDTQQLIVESSFEILGAAVHRTASHQRCRLALTSLRKQRTASPARTSGDHRAVEPPVPIPNTAVKRCSPDGSATKGRARVGRRQNEKPVG